MLQSIDQSVNHKTVAVITTTIGREQLEKAILSVQAQTYPCQHYVFVDGKAHWHKVAHLVEKYPQVIFTFLPMNTGGKNNIGNGAIHAIAPYLVEEDIFCFLDDDNWHDPDHVEHLVKMIDQYQLDYAYSLRKLYDKNYQFICEDNTESLGFWKEEKETIVDADGELLSFKTGYRFLVDTNTYALTRQIAFKLSSAWYSGVANDAYVFQTLLDLNARGGCTAKYSTNYKSTPKLIGIPFPEAYIYSTLKQHNQTNGELFAWQKPTILIDQKLIVVDE